MKKKTTAGILTPNIAVTTCNVIYSVFLAIILSNFYTSDNSNGPGFQCIFWELSDYNRAFLLCIILYIILMWLMDTVYNSSPALVSDIYLIGSLIRVIFFGFCFYEAFNPTKTKYLMFFIAGFIEMIIEYFAYTNHLLPLVGKKTTSSKPLEQAESSEDPVNTLERTRIISGLFFFFRLLALVGIFCFSGLWTSDSASIVTHSQASVILFCLVIFLIVKMVAWRIIRKLSITTFFKTLEINA